MKSNHPLVSPPSSPDAPEMRKIARTWELFVAGENVDLSDLSPVIREAWVRSKHAGVDPALPEAPYTVAPTDLEVLQEETDWLSCAEPVVSFLRDVLAEPHQLIFLGDHQGRVLLAQGGHKAITRAEELHGVPGGQWSEDQVGCTILGTSLATGTPVQVSWQENYCVSWKDWINHSAPIRAPGTNEILGALGIAGYRELSHPRALDLVIKAAGMIEVGIREQTVKARALVLEHFIRLTTRYPTEGLLALDKKGHILALNPIAEKMLNLPYARLIGSRMQDHPVLREYLGQSVMAGFPDPALGQERLPQATVFPVSVGRTIGAVVLLPHSLRPSRKEPSQQPWAATYTFTDLIGNSAQFRECIDFARTVSQQNWPVLLLGESGTGKELFAQAIHNASPRGSSPFVVFNCASINDEMIGTELFGYAEGTFTGALKGGKVGKIQLAHRGTLFLDDIDGMPLRMQLSLLRVLEENRVVRLGGQAPQTVDVRVIAASNSDLERAVGEGRFRHDLYYRLNTFPLTLPALRERAEDIPLLAKHLLARYAPTVEVSEEAVRLLRGYAWPGNVRELRNVLLGASARARHGLITPADLPATITRSSIPITPVAEQSPTQVQSLKETEAELIVRALRQTASIPQAAALLGLHYSTLYRKLKKHKINPSLNV